MNTIIQIFLVLVMLAAMVMVLLSIGRLSKGMNFDDPEKTSELKKEIGEDVNVVTGNSVFDYLVAKRVSGKSSSNGPSSRRL